MISYEEALRLLRENALSPKIDVLSLRETAGFVAAETLRAHGPTPSFDNSAMDGFALRAADAAAAPVHLAVVGGVAAGDAPVDVIGEEGVGAQGTGIAFEIMTGAPLPAGFDSVVPIEDVEILSRSADNRPRSIRITAPASKGANVRTPGEDYQAGSVVVKKGTRLGAVQLMALSATGLCDVPVFQKPRVAVFSTGREVIDDLCVPLPPGKIRNASAPFLMTALKQSGAEAQYKGLIGDDPGVFEARLKDAANSADIIISTGAVSAGRFDFVPSSLERLGSDVIFRKVAIRPGKPVLFARLKTGALFFGLPGNPVSTAVGFRFFVWPVMERMSGLEPERFLTAELVDDTPRKKWFRRFLKARAFFDAHGRLKVRILKEQESFKIHSLVEANCWAQTPPGETLMSSGETISIASLVPLERIDVDVCEEAGQ